MYKQIHRVSTQSVDIIVKSVYNTQKNVVELSRLEYLFNRKLIPLLDNLSLREDQQRLLLLFFRRLSITLNICIDLSYFYLHDTLLFLANATNQVNTKFHHSLRPISLFLSLVLLFDQLLRERTKVSSIATHRFECVSFFQLGNFEADKESLFAKRCDIDLSCSGISCLPNQKCKANSVFGWSDQILMILDVLFSFNGYWVVIFNINKFYIKIHIPLYFVFVFKAFPTKNEQITFCSFFTNTFSNIYSHKVARSSQNHLAEELSLSFFFSFLIKAALKISVAAYIRSIYCVCVLYVCFTARK